MGPGMSTATLPGRRAEEVLICGMSAAARKLKVQAPAAMASSAAGRSLRAAFMVKV